MLCVFVSSVLQYMVFTRDTTFGYILYCTFVFAGISGAVCLAWFSQRMQSFFLQFLRLNWFCIPFALIAPFVVYLECVFYFWNYIHLHSVLISIFCIFGTRSFFFLQ